MVGSPGFLVGGLEGRCNKGVAELSEGNQPVVILSYQADAELALLCLLDSLINDGCHLKGDAIICCDAAKIREYGHGEGSNYWINDLVITEYY